MEIIGMIVVLKILESKEPWRVFHCEYFKIESPNFLKVVTKYLGPIDRLEIFFEPATWHFHVVFPFKMYGFSAKKYKDDFIRNKKWGIAERKREIEERKALRFAKRLEKHKVIAARWEKNN